MRSAILLSVLVFATTANAAPPVKVVCPCGPACDDCDTTALLPWRRQIEDRMRGDRQPATDPTVLEMLRQIAATQQQILALLQHQQQTPPVIVLGTPYQTLPVPGTPRQELPPQGAPRQELPPQGAPRQELPPSAVPRQEVPPTGPPRQELPPGRPSGMQRYSVWPVERR
jgi:hypothetical protein